MRTTRFTVSQKKYGSESSGYFEPILLEIKELKEYQSQWPDTHGRERMSKFQTWISYQWSIWNVLYKNNLL